MNKLILIFAFITLAAGTTESTNNEKTEIAELGQTAWVCPYIGLMITPLTGAVFAVFRCLVKDGLDVFTCISEDLLITAMSTLGLSVFFCVL